MEREKCVLLNARNLLAGLTNLFQLIGGSFHLAFGFLCCVGGVPCKL